DLLLFLGQCHLAGLRLVGAPAGSQRTGSEDKGGPEKTQKTRHDRLLGGGWVRGGPVPDSLRGRRARGEAGRSRRGTPPRRAGTVKLSPVSCRRCRAGG